MTPPDSGSPRSRFRLPRRRRDDRTPDEVAHDHAVDRIAAVVAAGRRRAEEENPEPEHISFLDPAAGPQVDPTVAENLWSRWLRESWRRLWNWGLGASRRRDRRDIDGWLDRLRLLGFPIGDRRGGCRRLGCGGYGRLLRRSRAGFRVAARQRLVEHLRKRTRRCLVLELGCVQHAERVRLGADGLSFVLSLRGQDRQSDQNSSGSSADAPHPCRHAQKTLNPWKDDQQRSPRFRPSPSSKARTSRPARFDVGTSSCCSNHSPQPSLPYRKQGLV